MERVISAENKVAFLRKVELRLEGSPYDQDEDEMTKDDCMLEFNRMTTVNGFRHLPVSNDISYEEFNKSGYFVKSKQIEL